MLPKEYTQTELKKAWGFGPPTRELPCGGCKYLTSVQGYFYSCASPERPKGYYGFMGNADPGTGLKSCGEARTKRPRNINPHNPLGE